MKVTPMKVTPVKLAVLTFVSCALVPITAVAQFDEQAAVKQQLEALQPLQWMDGQWRGNAWIILPNGQREEMTQTERVGPLLGGTVKVVEGRGFDGDGTTVFNAMGVIAFDAQKQKLMFRSYARGRIGDFELDVRDDGFAWTIPAGGAEIRYTATFKDGLWLERGERVIPGREPFPFFEMKLKRIADSSWPAKDAVAAK